MKYELSFIISPAIPETEQPALNKDILGYLKDAQATISKEPYFMGRRKLAYAIAKQKHGFYVFLEFETEEKQALKELDIKLKHDNRLLRHLIIKLDRAGEYSDTSFINFKDNPADIIDNRGDNRRVVKRTPVRAKTPFRAPVKTEVRESAVKVAKEKISLDDIDKKLDAILKEPNVD